MKDSNKLIAEFMGFTLVDGSKGNCFLAPKGWDILMMDDGNGNSDFNYHKSWDWLMSVVESCFERLEASDTSADSIKEELALCYKDGVYKEVVKFIVNHNKLL